MTSGHAQAIRTLVDATPGKGDVEQFFEVAIGSGTDRFALVEQLAKEPAARKQARPRAATGTSTWTTSRKRLNERFRAISGTGIATLRTI